MADDKTKPLINLSPKSHNDLVDYINALVQAQAQFSSFTDRLESIDMDYYLYKKQSTRMINGRDNQPKPESEIEDIIEAPIAVSQVDSVVAYLTSLYLSGYPLFGIVTSKEYQSAGEQLEAMIDSHAIRGRWGREFILSFIDAAKYNICGVHQDWGPITTLNAQNDTTSSSSIPKLETRLEYINKVKSLDLYNSFWDYSKAPSDVSEKGEYIGYHELVNKTELKTESIALSAAMEAYNLREAFNSSFANDNAWYKARPIVTNSLTPPAVPGVDWIAYARNLVPRSQKVDYLDYSRLYLKTTAYIRIIPSEFGLNVPAPNTPQIYKVTLINGKYIIGLRRVITPFNMMPIMLGQLQEDGFSYQTKSVLENAMPWQDATTELLNIRLSSARRAISDRAVYNPDVLSAHDVNTRSPAAKIPMKPGLRGDLANAQQAYAAIPFNDSGTSGTIGDINSLLTLNEYLYGINASKQGVFKKGNRTLGEYSDVQQSSDDRLRVMALRLDAQIFIPLKFHIKSNILLYAEESKLVRQSTGTVVNVDIATLREAILDFKVSDGLTPKSKILPTDVLMSFMQFIQGNPEVNREYDVIKAVSHVMNLAGISNLDQYKRDPQEIAQRDQEAQQRMQAEAAAQQPQQPQQQPGAVA
jgi:hypothetical protein